MMLDQRFLRVLPRTRLWWAQRETCRTCAHYRAETSTAGGVTEHCAAGHAGGGRFCACIDMRDEGQACGTEAALFVLSELVAA